VPGQLKVRGNLISDTTTLLASWWSNDNRDAVFTATLKFFLREGISTASDHGSAAAAAASKQRSSASSTKKSCPPPRSRRAINLCGSGR